MLVKQWAEYMPVRMQSFVPIDVDKAARIDERNEKNFNQNLTEAIIKRGGDDSHSLAIIVIKERNSFHITA